MTKRKRRRKGFDGLLLTTSGIATALPTLRRGVAFDGTSVAAE
jgi:hypothetical protein